MEWNGLRGGAAIPGDDMISTQFLQANSSATFPAGFFCKFWKYLFWIKDDVEEDIMISKYFPIAKLSTM